MTRVSDALSGTSNLAFDTAPLIYFVESNPSYVAVMREIFKLVDSGTVAAFTSVITLLEVLVRPKQAGRTDIEGQYRAILLHGRNLTLLPIGPIVAEIAADLRARFGIRTPDALQIAAAIDAGCDVFLTNDSVLQRVSRIKVIMLDNLTL